MAHLSNKLELLSNISRMLNNTSAMRNDMFAMIRIIDCRHGWQSWCVCWLRRKGSTSKGSDAQRSKSKVQLQAESSTEKQKHVQKRITLAADRSKAGTRTSIAAMAFASRLKVDPAIGVMDLQKVLVQEMQRREDHNLWNSVKHPTNASWSWKTAPNMQWLAQARQLLCGFLEIAPNGLLPSSKLRLSLQRLVVDSSLKVNKTSYHTDDWVDQMDQRIRVLLSQARALKKADTYVTSMRKATAGEKEAVDDILSRLNLGSVEEANPQTAESSCRAMVLYEPEEAARSRPAVRSPGKVFKRILERQSSSPMKVGTEPGACSTSKALPAESSSKPLPATPSSSLCAEQVRKKAPPGLMMGSIPSSSESEEKAPVAKKAKRSASKTGKSQSSGLQKKQIQESEDCNLQESKTSAAKIGESESYGLEEDDLQMLDSVLDKKIESTGVKKKPALKKPAACTKKEDEPADISEPNMADGKSKKKCTFKHRKTSSVYAKERNLRLKMGCSPESAKKFARAAMSEVAAKIDAGILTED